MCDRGTEGIFVIDARSIMKACIERNFKIDYGSLVRSVCDCLELSEQRVEVFLVLDRKGPGWENLESAICRRFENLGIRIRIMWQTSRGVDVAIASILLSEVLAQDAVLSHVILVSGEGGLGVVLSQINKHKKNVYKVVVQFLNWVQEDLRQHADKVLEIGYDLFAGDVEYRIRNGNNLDGTNDCQRGAA